MPSNFEFIRTEWPEMYADCVRAEGYGRTDPRSCAFYGRRVVEQVVTYIYDIEALAPPYKVDLAARIADPAFKAVVGNDIATKATVIRKVGNVAVHDSRSINEPTALNLLQQLHHLIVWTAFRYSTQPDLVPTSASYDPSSIPAHPTATSPPPLTQTELNQLLETFGAKDQAIEDAKRGNQALQAEIDQLRQEIRSAQAAKASTADQHDYDEAATRDMFIDLLLNEAGWALTDVRDREFEVAGMPVSPGSTTGSGRGFVDYVLWGADGLPLAVVEAKRTQRDPAVGQQQAKLYADCLENTTGRRPVIFYTNGYQHWIWDDAAGYPPRKVQGFYTRDELG